MKVCWFSAGISSFITAYLVRESLDEIIYCHIEEQHPDTLRFIHDCEQFLERKITILQSPYKSVSNVIDAFQYIHSNHFAKCTEILKKRVRKEWEYGKNDLTYVWGYDVTEKHRSDRLYNEMLSQEHEFPLIENGFTKSDCHGLSKKLGLKRPITYDMGYQNNNCIGCVKGGMWYWNKIRVDFPEVFALRAKQEREIGYTCIRSHGKQIFLDELEPNRGRPEDEISEECNFVCQIAAS